jgi:methionyl-tRNA formyltransferase
MTASAQKIDSCKIALFASHFTGLEIASYLSGDAANKIDALYLTGQSGDYDDQIKSASTVTSDRIFSGPDIVRDPKHIEWFQNEKFDAVICVYWPWLLRKEIYATAGITLNFHPAMLPVNRGWFPHVHSLIDGSKAGVTLHRIEDHADNGAVWVQREVPVQPTDTAKSLYERLQQEIITLFKENWADIRANRIMPKPQDESLAVYHAKKEIERLDRIDPEATVKVRDFLRLLRARSFGSRGFAYYEDDGKRIYLKVDLSETGRF